MQNRINTRDAKFRIRPNIIINITFRACFGALALETMSHTNTTGDCRCKNSPPPEHTMLRIFPNFKISTIFSTNKHRRQSRILTVCQERIPFDSFFMMESPLIFIFWKYLYLVSMNKNNVSLFFVIKYLPYWLSLLIEDFHISGIQHHKVSLYKFPTWCCDNFPNWSIYLEMLCNH